MMQNDNLDEILLIDYLCNRLDAEQMEIVRKRLEEDHDLRVLKDNLTNTFSALDCAPKPTPPCDLVEKTLERIASVQRTNALLSLQQLEPPQRFRRTFSMKELVAIAAVMLIAVGISIPSLQMARRRGQRGLCASQMGQLGNALQGFAINNDGYLPGVGSKCKYWLSPDGEKGVSNSAALFRLLKENYHHSPISFQCPAVGGTSFAVSSEMSDFPKSEHIHYSYQHSLDRGPKSLIDEFNGRMVILADQSSRFKNGRYQKPSPGKACSENHGGRGQNVLYLDGHCEWTTCSRAGVDQDDIYSIQGNPENYTGNEAPASPHDTFLLPAWVGR
jgi:prepilin-type processing-associated H-X9-DG protein